LALIAMKKPTAILIAGPTASGKSKLALALAERHRGTVINADSMQVYCELRILSARPTEEEEARAPHALYGHVAGDEGYSAGRFLLDAARAIAEAGDAGRLPIIVGGTGLYFKALTEGLSPIPAIPTAVKERWRSQARSIGAPGLFARLVASDPETAARLSPTDRQRLTRALEVLETTGVGLSTWQQQRGQPLIDRRGALCLVAAPEREALYRRAEARFDAMLQAGTLAEVEALMGRKYTADLPIMHALGVQPLARHLAGDIGLEAAAALAKTETRQYIKRQLTWLRRNMMSWRSIDEQEMERVIAKDLSLIDN
jgi:tRNA dimethylallyltransferase